MFSQAADATLYQPIGKRNQQAPERVGINPFALLTLRASKCQSAFVNTSLGYIDKYGGSESDCGIHLSLQPLHSAQIMANLFVKLPGTMRHTIFYCTIEGALLHYLWSLQLTRLHF